MKRKMRHDWCAAMQSRCNLRVKLNRSRRKKSDEEMHTALLLHCYDEFSQPAHASMHSRCNCPVEQKADEENYAALKDVQNPIDAEKLNSRPKKPITASRLALHYGIATSTARFAISFSIMIMRV